MESMYKRNIPLSNNEVRSAEVNLLLQFDSLCRKNNLRYSLSGGTLLGAIRHKGFIPWDDDIDINMPRPDFDQLVSLIDTDPMLYANNCYFERILNGMVSPIYLKMCNQDIFIKEKLAASIRNLGIDIFPMDGLPDELNEIEKIYSRSNWYRRILDMTIKDISSSKSSIKRALKTIVVPISKAIGIDYWCAKKLVSLSKTVPYGSTDSIGGIAWGLYGTGERVSSRAFEHCVMVEFEGYRFPAMSCWEEYLTGLYGDFMVLPPEDKRINHGVTAWCIEESQG